MSLSQSVYVSFTLGSVQWYPALLATGNFLPFPAWLLGSHHLQV